MVFLALTYEQYESAKYHSVAINRKEKYKHSHPIHSALRPHRPLSVSSRLALKVILYIKNSNPYHPLGLGNSLRTEAIDDWARPFP